MVWAIKYYLLTSEMAGTASMISGGLLTLLALNQGVSIAAAALVLTWNKGFDQSIGQDYTAFYSNYTRSLYPSCFIFAASGLTFFFCIALIGCLSRRNISVIPSTIIAAFIMSLQVAIGALFAIYTCQLISPFGPHSSSVQNIYDYSNY